MLTRRYVFAVTGPNILRPSSQESGPTASHTHGTAFKQAAIAIGCMRGQTEEVYYLLAQHLQQLAWHVYVGGRLQFPGVLNIPWKGQGKKFDVATNILTLWAWPPVYAVAWMLQAFAVCPTLSTKQITQNQTEKNLNCVEPGSHPSMSLSV